MKKKEKKKKYKVVKNIKHNALAWWLEKACPMRFFLRLKIELVYVIRKKEHPVFDALL